MSSSYTLPVGSHGSPAFTLTANEVTTVTFVEDLHSVAVISNGSSAVWWTCDGSTPAIDGPRSFYVPTFGIDTRQQPSVTGGTVVKLISAGTPTIRVQRGE